MKEERYTALAAEGRRLQRESESKYSVTGWGSIDFAHWLPDHAEELIAAAERVAELERQNAELLAALTRCQEDSTAELLKHREEKAVLIQRIEETEGRSAVHQQPVEVLTRKPCTRCGGKLGYEYEGSHGWISWVKCFCTDRKNVAGPGFEVEWVQLAVGRNEAVKEDSDANH